MYFDIPVGNLGDDREYMWKSSIVQIFKKNPYSRVNKYKKEHNIDEKTTINIDHYAITTNYRVFIEQIDWDALGPMRHEKLHGWELGLDKEYVLSFLCEPNEHHDKRLTFQIICDRGVSHELVRHRVFSFAQESTRYCNYMKERFGSELTFIIPSHLDLQEGQYLYWDGDWCDAERMTVMLKDADTANEINTFLYALTHAEQNYMYLINHGWKPQQARAILPNALKTSIVMTGYESDWKYFLGLRYEGVTGPPHPDMKVIASQIQGYFEK
jgi:thymidylate synthase (FAD)